MWARSIFVRTCRLGCRGFSFLSRQVPPPFTFHGRARVDEFAWIQGNANFLHEQNEVTDLVLNTPKILAWKSHFTNEFAHFHPGSQMPMELIGDYFYYSEHAPDGSPVYCRHHRSEKKKEEILNLATIASEHGREHDSYYHVSMFRVSLDSRFLAYTLDLNGDEMYTAYIRDLKTGHMVDQIENVVSIEWAQHLLQPMLVFSTGGSEFRASQVCVRPLGGSDSIIYVEPDPTFHVDLALTKDRNFLLVKTSSKTSSEVRVVSAYMALGPLILVQTRQPEVEYFLEHSQDQFVMVTNERAPNKKVLLSPIDQFQWREFVPHERFTVIQEFDVFRDHLVLYQTHKAHPQLSIVNLSDGAHTLVPLPHAVGELTPGVNSNFLSSSVRFCFSNPIFPTTTFDFAFSSHTLTTVQADVYNGVCNNLTCELVFVPSSDVTNNQEPGDPESDWVPLTIVRDKACREPSPLLLQAYGAYGMTVNLGFDLQRYCLLKQGWVLAFCHSRGGGELGALWHRAGSLSRKKQTFKDIIACANYLVATGITQNALLTGFGVSAGGMALAVVANSRPDMFRALVLKVPAVDLLGSMLDSTLPTTNLETAEWGDPITSAEAFDYLLQYSPYDNLRHAFTFPSVYITAGLRDSRVGWWEPAKYAAKLSKIFSRDASPPLVLLRSNMEGGHAQNYDENAEAYAFLCHVLAIGPPR